MTKKYLDDNGLSYFWGKLKNAFQEKLVSGTNIKTINNNSLLGSGNITISGGGSGGVSDVTVNGTSVVTSGVAEIDLSSYVAKDGSGNVSIAGGMTVGGHDSAIGTVATQVTQSISVTTGTTWTIRNIQLQVSPGTWLVTAYASCPGSTTGDRALGITYGSATGNLVQSRVTQRANSGSSIAAMQTTMVVATNTSNRTYTIEYWQNSNSTKTVEFRLNAVRIA